MPLALEGSVSSATTVFGTSLTFSHTTNGASTLLVVTIEHSGITVVTGVTFNADALTLSDNFVGATGIIDIWYRLNPDLSVTGDIVVTLDSVGAIYAAGYNFSGNDTATPLGAMAETEGTTVSSWSINVSSASGDICVDHGHVSQDEAADPWEEDAGQTERWRIRNEGSVSDFGSTEPATGATTAMGWSRTAGANIIAVGIAVKQASTPPHLIVGPNSERASGGMVGLNRLRL